MCHRPLCCHRVVNITAATTAASTECNPGATVSVFHRSGIRIEPDGAGVSSAGALGRCSSRDNNSVSIIYVKVLPWGPGFQAKVAVVLQIKLNTPIP